LDYPSVYTALLLMKETSTDVPESAHGLKQKALWKRHSYGSISDFP